MRCHKISSTAQLGGLVWNADLVLVTEVRCTERRGYLSLCLEVGIIYSELQNSPVSLQLGFNFFCDGGEVYILEYSRNIVDCVYLLLSGVQAQGAGRTYLRRTDGIRQWAAVITVSNTNSLL